MSHDLGTLDVLELDVFCHEFGRGFLPYPFRRIRPAPYQFDDELTRYRQGVLERYRAGEFDHLRRWLDVQLRDAEIRVDSMFMNQEEVTLAFSASRWQEFGYIATQRDDDVISVTQVTAYQLGAEVGKLAQLSGRPGEHARVAVPSLHVGARTERPRSAGTTIADQVKSIEAVSMLAFEDLVAGGEIHTDHRPPERWGRDRNKEFVAWLNTKYGDYIIQEPYEYATPVTRTQLVEKIDRLIAGDVARIRELRADAFSG